jgi:hypothetical protein
MVDVNDAKAEFEFIRGLAYRLDIHVGVEKRKLIMAGNEKLTMATDNEKLSLWMKNVSERMLSSVSPKTYAKIIDRLTVPSRFSFKP